MYFFRLTYIKLNKFNVQKSILLLASIMNWFIIIKFIVNIVYIMLENIYKLLVFIFIFIIITNSSLNLKLTIRDSVEHKFVMLYVCTRKTAETNNICRVLTS